jgi:hypothetical protein
MKILLNRNVKLLFFVLCTCLSILILQNVSKVQAQANSVINFQGKIVDRVSGVNVVSGSPSCVVAGASNDTCDIRVNIYTDSGGGTLMFQEVHSNKEIGEYNGVFNIQINSVCNTWSGSASPPAGCTATPTVSGITWGNDPTIYIEIQLDADGNGDFSSPETFSRKLLNSVPYAYYADNAGSVDGISSENIVQLQPSGAQSASGSNTLIFLNETGGSTPNLMQLQVGGSNRFTITNNGQVNLADSTTGSSQINFGTGGGTPSTPTEGDMWYTGTSLNFFDGSTTHDLLAAGGGSLFTDGGSVTYLTSTTDDLAIGGSTLANSIFGVDVSSGDIQIGAVGSVDPSINIENSTGEVLNIDYEVGNILNINSASGNTKIGLNKTAPDYELDVDGSIQVTGSIFSDTTVTVNGPGDYDGSDIGSTTNPFANIYTYGLLVKGISTFEADILASAPTESLGSATTISSTNDVGRHTDIIIGNNGLPFIGAYDVTGADVLAAGCNNMACSSPTVTTFTGTGGGVGDNEVTVLNRSTGFPIIGYYESTGQDMEAIDCTTVTCSTGVNRNIELTASGVQSTAWVNPNNNFPIWIFARTAGAVLSGNNCTAANCSAVGTIYTVGTNQTGTEGQHPDVVVKTDGLPIVFTMDEDDGELEIVNCTNGSCSGFEATRVMDDGGDGAGGTLVGEHVEVILGKDTLPLAVYRDVTNQSIKLIKCKDIICGDIDIRTIRDTADNLGVNQFGIALKGDGSPVISYHNETTGTLNVYECASVECSTGTNHVLTSTGDQGEYSSMVRVPGNKDRFLISYYDRTGGDLEMFDFNKTYTGGVSLGTSTNYFANLYTANIYTKNATINNFDVAEEYIAADETIEAGDIVRFTEETDNTKESLIKVEKTDKRYDNRAIGVISTEPGLYLKNWDQNIQGSRPVALVGRVPVKVTDENGEIRRGDYITASSTPGYGMRARSGGMIIGRAMEDFKGGDSTNVREFIEKEREEAEELLKQYEEEENPDEEQINILKQKIEELYEQEQNIESTRGRIMMYVDLTYIPEENFEEKEEIIEAFETEEAENTEEIDKLTKLSQYIESTDNTVTITAEKLIINGALSVTGDLEVSGNLTAQNAYIQEWIIRNQIKIENDQIKGSVTMPSGQTEITVASQALTEDSLILLSVPNRISYELEKDIPNKTFKAILKEPLLEDLNITYLIIN